MQEIFEIFGINWKLLFAQAVNFGLLLAVLWYFLYRPLLKMIETRREKIREGVENAEKAEERLSAIEGEKEQIVTEAVRKAESIVEDGKKRATSEEGRLVKDAQEKSERIVKDAQMRAEEIARKAEEANREEIARLAVLGAEKILRK